MGRCKTMAIQFDSFDGAFDASFESVSTESLRTKMKRYGERGSPCRSKVRERLAIRLNARCDGLRTLPDPIHLRFRESHFTWSWLSSFFEFSVDEWLIVRPIYYFEFVFRVQKHFVHWEQVQVTRVSTY